MVMCPDDPLLSAFVDDEVPSPWKERMETHIAGCSRCSEKAHALRSLKRILVAAETDFETEALAVARARIAASIDFSMARGHTKAGLTYYIRSLWSRRIPLPMPFFAVGLLALVFLVGMSLGLIAPFTSTARTIASKIISPQSTTLEMMAQYMKQSSVQPVMIEMPQESVFNQLGNPVIVFSSEPAIQKVTTTSNGGASP
jgi:hypothetical protein